MDEIVRTHIDILKRTSDSRGFVSPSNVPRELVELIGQIVNDCTSRLEQGRGLPLGLSDIAWNLTGTMRAINGQLPLTYHELETIQMAVHLRGELEKLDFGRPLADNPAYEPLAQMLYQSAQKPT
jgi:hypothetical protein